MATINGTNNGDNLNGTDLADQIFGLGGNDILIGFDGDDVLDGGAGADDLFGSPGVDLVSYRSSPAGVEITLEYFEGEGGHAEGDRYFSIEGVIGSAYNDFLFGTEERDVLRGEGGSDYLSAYGGNDVISGGGGNDVLYAAAGADEMRGDGGIDFAYYPGSSEAVRVDLAAGKGFGGAAEGDRLFSVEGVYGSYLSDRISGNAAANQFRGYQGADTLSGAGGADRFFYFESESTVATPDRILDFSRGQGDKIVVGTMDANLETGAHQSFRFIGKAAFTDAGQLRWFQQNGDTIVEGNTTDATAGPELRIVLDPLVNVQAADFIFADIGFGPLVA